MPSQVRSSKRQVSIDPTVFVVPSSPGEKPRLIGTRCKACGKHFFPQEPVCQYCFSRDVEVVPLSTRGKVYACTIFRHHRRVPQYEGTVPYMFGKVELPEGVGILTSFADVSLEEPLEEGTEVELRMEKFGEDEEGNEVMTFKFAPVQRERAV